MAKRIVWLISGVDTSGGAGIAKDIQIFTNFNVHTCPIISCIAPQNNQCVLEVTITPLQTIEAQVFALIKSLPPQAVKIGLIKNTEVMKFIASVLEYLNVPVVIDPVISSSSGFNFLTQEEVNCYKRYLIPQASIITPNLFEVESILNCKLTTIEEIEKAAINLLNLGTKNVIITGGHSSSNLAKDYWTNGKDYCWLTYPKVDKKVRGTGCTFASALCANLIDQFHIANAFLKAKRYVFDGIQQAYHTNNETNYFFEHKAQVTSAFPTARSNLISVMKENFLPAEPIGFYPIVENLAELIRLAKLGVTTLQLRIKGQSEEVTAQLIREACYYAKRNHLHLYINDHWQLAIQFGAHGIHLGQEDLLTADLLIIQKSGLRVGISAHNEFELLTAIALKPSYIAIGPIFFTAYKPQIKPLSCEIIKLWRTLSPLPLVVIGGINLTDIPKLICENVDGIAMISAIKKATDTEIRRSLRYVTSSLKHIGG